MLREPGSLHLGTMGWTYRDWFGSFYPRDADRKVLLRQYARVFGTLEIGRTFQFYDRGDSPDSCGASPSVR